MLFRSAEGLGARKARAALTFLNAAYGSIPAGDRAFIDKILRGEPQRVLREDRRKLCEAHSQGTTPQLLLGLLTYIERLDYVSLKLHESVSALHCILEEHIESGSALACLYADEIAYRRSEEHTSELQSLMRISYAVFCLKNKKHQYSKIIHHNPIQ